MDIFYNNVEGRRTSSYIFSITRHVFATFSNNIVIEFVYNDVLFTVDSAM